MTTTAAKYISGLKEAYANHDLKEYWAHFEQIKHGAATEDIEKLKQVYPDVPAELISLLEYVDGTYWRTYAGEEIALLFLGSDVEEYAYYLLSSKEIIDNEHQVVNNFSDYIERKYEEVDIDDKITDQADTIQWLHFSDCMNNGGTSQLFIDFSPSPKGKKGQVVRFLHDPDSLTVIADSFDDYLKNLMDKGYDFISDETLG